MFALLGSGCGGGSDARADHKSVDETSATSSASTSAPASAVTPTASESSLPVSVDAEDLLVQRDEGDAGRWESDDPDTPALPEFSSKNDCSEFNALVFKVEQGESEAAAGWFDPKTIDVTASDQVVRVYPTADEAAAAVDEVQSFLNRCGSWREGSKAPGGWRFEASRWNATAIPDGAVGWRVKTSLVDVGGGAASTWHVTARYDNVVTTAASTSLDDVATKAQQDAVQYADAAGQLILEAQGPSTESGSPDASKTPLTPQAKCVRRSGNPGEIYVWSSYGNDQPPDAMRLGAGYVWDFGEKECVTTTEFALRTVPVSMSGYCSQVGKVADNPGYRVNARPAPRLSNVIGQRGDC